MHSKWQVWDFFQTYPKGSFAELNGKIILQAFDSLSLRMMKDHLVASLEDRPKYLVANEISLSWLENEFLNLGFFANDTSYIVNNPDELNAAAKEFFLNSDYDLSSRRIAFAFHQDTAFLKKMLKTQVTHIQIESPRFYEMDKLIDFLSKYFRLPLDFASKKFLLDAVENEFSALFDTFRLVKLNFPEKPIVNLEDVKSLVGQERLDQFSLATQLSKKNFSIFFEKLLSVPFDYERYRLLFSFLQSHMIKICDPSYLKGKPRLTNYDKEILSLNKIWTLPEIKTLLLQLQEWEIDCKKKEMFLLTKLRQSQLLALKNAWPES
jgi:hypothetical protein